MDEADLIRIVTKCVREADDFFEKSGGSSRHWVAECFLPLLDDCGLEIVQKGVEPKKAILITIGKMQDDARKRAALAQELANEDMLAYAGCQSYITGELSALMVLAQKLKENAET